VATALAWLAAWEFTPGYETPRAGRDLAPWAQSIRSFVVDEAARLGGDGGALLPGVVLGDTSAVPESLANAMRVTSLTHLMAVSGANCAIVTGFAFGIAVLIGLNLWWRVACSAMTLVGFVLLVGPEPSVLRAAAMSLLALATLAIGVPVAGITVLCLAVLACLAIEPSLAHSMGFALSVAATLGILVLVRPLAAKLTAVMPRRIALVLAVPISASIACQPILFVLAPYVPTYGVLANALAEPLVPIATIAGLLALLVAPVPWLTTGLLWIGWLTCAAIAAIARFLAALPFARISWPAGSLGFVLGAVVSLSLAVWITRLASARTLAITATATTLALSLTAGGSVLTWATVPRDWSWAQCDVGQGDAVIVRDSGAIALIDTGRDESALRDCLDRLGVHHINLLVLTHFDIDHVGAVGALYGRVDEVLHGPTDGIADEAILTLLDRDGAMLHAVTQGMAGALGRLDWRVEWPLERSVEEPGNPSSVVVRFTPGVRCDRTCVSGIDLGDLPAEQQAKLRLLGGASPVTIVKVSHHGSHDQDADFYRMLNARIGLIGVGVGNDYGHPTVEALDILAATGTTVIRSDRNGIALVARDVDGVLRVWRERG
jgi:competence protein ComEC